MTRAQEDLLRRAVRVTRPGGTILYVTCTFAPEENEAIVDRVLADEPVELEPILLPVPHEPGLTRFDDLRFDARVEGAARIYPHHFDSGGLFLARLRRLDGVPTAPTSKGAWTPVPRVFPGDGLDPAEGNALVARAMASLRDDYGIEDGDLPLTPILRGGRLWLHALESWPMEAWSEGSWRPISVGFRAVEFDSRGRPRPTNDLLQWLGPAVGRSAVELDDDDLLRLLDKEVLPLQEEELRGPVALRFRGEVVGRGMATRDGLRGEVPKARAADLANLVRAEISPDRGSTESGVED